MVNGKLHHVKQWPNQSSYTSNHLIAKRDKYPCHEKQWPTPTSVVWEFYELFNDMPLDSRMQTILLEFAIKIKGMYTDHAEDQKKLACLIQMWKKLCECELHSKLVLWSMEGLTLSHAS